MIFNVCFDPAVIEAAAANGPYAMQALIAMLRGFSANCVLMDFEDARLQNRVRAAIRGLPPLDERDEIIRIFTRLEDRKRFVPAMEAPDWAAPESDIQHVFWKARNSGVQLVVTETEGCVEVESASLATFQHTCFERERFNGALNGRVFAERKLTGPEFLTESFANALRFAGRVQICDRLLGKKFADNFEYTIKALLQWIEPLLHDPAACEITFHCERAPGRDDHLCHMVRSFRTGRLAQTVIKVAFYDNPTAKKPALPHDRFLWTDQFAFDIGRGMDFLDPVTLKNRDVSINLKSVSEVTAAIGHCAGMMTETRAL